MPLSCDCYGGCWGDHAKARGWTRIPYTESRWLFTINRLVYGSYVVMQYSMDHCQPKYIYCENAEDAVLVMMGA